MLSHAQKLNDILILKPFKESILNLKLPSTLQDEIDRLNKCTQTTAHLEQWPDDS